MRSTSSTETAARTGSVSVAHRRTAVGQALCPGPRGSPLRAGRQLAADGRIPTASRPRRVLPDDRGLVCIIVVLTRGSDCYRVRVEGVAVDPPRAVRGAGGVDEAIAALRPAGQNAVNQTCSGGGGISTRRRSEC